MNIKKGNSVTLTIPITDTDGVAITDLASTTDIYFQVKINKSDVDNLAVINKTKADMTINDPITGTLKIILTSTDTDIPVGNYYFALELEYSASNKNEIDFDSDIFIVEQDTIRG